jgi:enoyl-CoA hydratase
LVRQEGGTAVLTLNRPEARNALDAELLGLLREAATAAGDEESVRAVVLTGAGDRAFCAGADIRGMAAMGEAEARRWAELGHDAFLAVESLPKPVIAAVNGSALGGGCELALVCDLRVLSATAQLGQPEIKLGLIPGWGGTQRLPRLVGMGLAKEMVLTGRSVGAEEALRYGLANRVVPAGRVLPEALQLAETVGALPPLALAYAKQALTVGRDLDLQKALALEVTLFGRVFATEDRAEGLAAFLEKRPPVFKGR